VLVCDERAALIASFTGEGETSATFAIGSGRPVRDLAWDEQAERLWATLVETPDRLVELTLDGSAHQAAFTSETVAGDLAPILTSATLWSVACDAPAGHLWLLTDGGALIRAAADRGTGPGAPAPEATPTVETIRELSLLREIRAVDREAGGTLLLADSGLLGTLVRIDGAGTVQDSIALNRTDAAPVRIEGFCRGNGRFYVLDGATDEVRLFGNDGSPQGGLGAAALNGRRPRGVHVAGNGHILVGTTGRLIELAANGSLLDEHPIPASAPPASVSSGQRPGDVMLFSPDRVSLTFLSGSFALRNVIVRTQSFPPQFLPGAATAGSAPQRGFVFVGTGDPTVLTTLLEQGSAAADRHWLIYP
jgi:hypothetical protein